MNKLFNRAIALGEHIPDDLNPRKRLQAQAEQISRLGDLQAHLDAVTASLVALSGILFDSENGRYVNIDPLTRRILVPVPWGSAGWKRWGLRKWEGGCLRKVLMDRLVGRQPLLFDYSDYPHGWFVERGYNDSESVLQWLHKYGPTLDEWRAVVEAHRATARARMDLRRN